MTAETTPASPTVIILNNIQMLASASGLSLMLILMTDVILIRHWESDDIPHHQPADPQGSPVLLRRPLQQCE